LHSRVIRKNDLFDGSFNLAVIRLKEFLKINQSIQKGYTMEHILKGMFLGIVLPRQNLIAETSIVFKHPLKIIMSLDDL